MSLFTRIKTRIKNWVNLDYDVTPDLHRPASGLCGSPGTVTMPLQPFLDLQFAAQAGTDTDVISKAHDLVRAVEFPETVTPSPTPTECEIGTCRFSR